MPARLFQPFASPGTLPGSQSPRRSAIKPPATHREDVVDEFFGTQVPDPYRWLEDPDSDDTKAFVDAQAAHTDAFLEELPWRAPMRKRMREVFGYERLGRPFRATATGELFFFYTPGLLPHPVLRRVADVAELVEHKADAASPPGTVVLDPNAWSSDGSVGLHSYAISRDGRWLAYAQTDGGTDWATVRFRDLSTLHDLPDTVQWLKFCYPAFLPDSNHILYSRFPATTDVGVHRNHEVWVHRLGTDQSEDRLVHARPDRPDLTLSAGVLDDHETVVLYASENAGDVNALYTASVTEAVIGPFSPLVDAFDATYSAVTRVDDDLLLLTDAGAPRYRVVAVPRGDPSPAHWREVVPEGPDKLLWVSRVGSRLFCGWLHDARTRVTVHRLDGTELSEVTLPSLGTVDGFEGEPDHQDTFFTFTSTTHPPTAFRYVLATDKVEKIFSPQVPFDTSTLRTDQIFVKSKDGTRIPAFVSYSGTLTRDGSRPVLLYGYGGFNIPLVPQFENALMPWFEQGGVYVVANLRGGGEYGRHWHEAGTKQHKQRVFDDFIAVADHLIAERYTVRERLAIHGHSNGGLLIGAVLVQCPERFGAALPAVGVLDMLRYQHFTIGRAWAADYGTAEDPELFPILLAYSPVHNAKPNTYPPTMVVTADHDDRVVPAHSLKFGAALQHAQQGEAPILLRIDRRSGHGAARSLDKVMDERADIFAFLGRALGLDG